MTLSEDNGKSSLKRWIALLASPVAWTVCFVAVYVLDELVCGLNLFRSLLGGRVAAIVPIMLFITAVTFLITIGDVYLGWQLWRESQDTEADRTSGRDRFIGLSAIMMGLFFALVTIALAVSAIVLEPC